MRGAFLELYPNPSDAPVSPCPRFIDRCSDILGSVRMEVAFRRSSAGETVNVLRVPDPDKLKKPESKVVGDKMEKMVESGAIEGAANSKPKAKKSKPKLPESVRKRLIAEGKLKE